MAKTFILSEETVNDRGYRILTKGIDLERFKKNPVMLWMHRRDNGWDLTQVLPIGIWENIRKEDGKLLADPKFDENDKFAQLIKSKVENDLIRSCSAGINPIEFSSDPKHLEKGQTRATITKCEIYEASIVDMPSNKNTVRLFTSAETAEVPLINNTEMADKKDEKTLTFESEANMLVFMKEKFGLEPKVEAPEKKPEETKQEFSFKSEEDARGWFQKLFGLQPKAKETEKKEDLKTEKVETEDSEKDKEIARLKAQIETFKKGPGAEDLKTTQETDEGTNKGEKQDTFQTYTSAKQTWDAIEKLVD